MRCEKEPNGNQAPMDGRRWWAPAGAMLAVMAASPGAAPAQHADFDDAWRRVVADHHATLDSAGIVGASLALVHQGEIVAEDHYGMADLAGRRPVDGRTLYHWASITKTVTAVAMMQLRDRGLLTLDDPVVRYVPELADVHDPYDALDSITLRQLLSHSAGFRAPTWPWGGDEDWHPHEPTEWSQLVAMMPYTRLHFQPGSRFGYSNPGVIFLGRTMETLTGDPYEAYVEKNILRPLGMRSAYFDLTPRHLLPRRSNNYRIVAGEPVANGLDFDTGITVSNGGLNASVADMALWVAFLTGAPVDRAAAHDAVLGRASLEEMWREVVPTGETEPLGREAMGLSFFLYEVDGARLVGHTGTQKSFRTFILLDPAARVGAIGAYNTADGDGTAPDTRAILDGLRRRVATEIFPLFPTHGRPAGT